jgi:CubicO group peptidase (beta-lactamase class C family)
MIRQSLVTAIAFALAVPFAPLAAQETTAVPAEQRHITAAGTSFIVPPGWAVTTDGTMTTLRPATGDIAIRMVDVGAASDADAALAAGLRIAAPTLTRTVLAKTEDNPQNGWEESWTVRYLTSPNERRTVFAAMQRRGTNWLMVFVDGSDAAFEVNLGPIGASAESLRPAGYTPENLANAPARPMDAARLAELRSFIETSMADLGVPGVGYAVVSGNDIVYAGGAGVRELGRPETVDGDTLFMIASNTKSMSTLVMAQMVDEGRIRWDQPVVELMPSFRMGTPEVTRAVQVRHLICACTGLPRQDLEWIMTADLQTPASEVFDMLSEITPTSGFGETYQYSNNLAAAAGFVAAHIAHPDMEVGAAYDRMIRERVFAPLGMTQSTFDFSAALAGNRATPHADNLAGDPAVAQFGFNDSVYFMRPTGGLWSSARDMAAYVRNELSQGVLPNGTRMVSAENLLRRRERGVRTGESAWYGMGLETEIISGIEVVHHGGSMAGYKSDIVMIPGANVGAVILTNSDSGGRLLRPFMRRLVELVYGGEATAARDVGLAARRSDVQREAAVARLTMPPNAAVVARLAARYTNAELGHIDVRRDGDQVIFNFGSFESRMATQANPDGTTAFVSIDPAVEGFEFTVRTGEPHDALVVRDAQHEYVYQPAG